MPENKKIIKKLLEEEKTEIKEMSIIYDNKQYSIRIPKEFAESIKEIIGNLKNMKFKFTFKLPPLGSKEKPKLVGELVYE